MSMDDALRLPDLRFVPVEALIPHEQHDHQRSGPLAQRLREQGMLRNPPIVTPLPPDDGRFVVLDGANRATALREAGILHIVVQVVRYDDPGVQLSTWHHALGDRSQAEIERSLTAIDGLACLDADLPHARAVLARREAIAYIAVSDQRALTLHGGTELQQWNGALNAVVDSYRTHTRFYRMASESLAVARSEHADVTALVVFPHFEPDEVLELAMNGLRMPAGITRHLIPRRALRINVPLERLADPGETLAAKNRWLEEWLRAKVSQREVRFYQESTVLFDE